MPIPSKGPVMLGGSKKPLDVQATFNDIINKREKKKKGNFLIIGREGEGKTYNLINAPKPVLIHSFDQGGTLCIPDDYIEKGLVIPDTTFEGDSARSPFAYRAWEQEFLRLLAAGVFDHVGTYVIDSLTGWAGSLLNAILSGRGRKPPSGKADLGKDPDIIPELSDYLLQQKTLTQWLAEVTSLPCHTAILGHLNIDKDELTGKMFSTVLLDGRKFPQLVPTLFDEVYYAGSKPAGPGKLRYYYQTVPKGIFQARSRLSQGTKLEAEEDQNLSEILKKAGFAYEDKPTFAVQSN